MAQRVVVAKTYYLNKKIGEGSFGKLFSANNKDNEYAIKLITNTHNSIWQNELEMYDILKGVKNIPLIHASGTEGKYHYIVMDMLEQNLEQLRQSFGDNMTLNVVIHLGLQMIEIIEAIHNKGIIHRDIKPANFLLKTNQQNITELYLIDFGISRCFYIDNDKKDTHIAIKTNEELIGTTRYMSVNVHQGLTASRRDDLESVGYILIYLHKGELPWQNAGEMALSIKQTMGWAYSINVVGEFILFIQYCRNLPFTAKPNYAYLRTILTNLSTII